MRYFHVFEQEEKFNEEYNGSGYTEPWVSVTKKNIGDVVSFVIQPYEDEITFYFMGEESEQDWYESYWGDVWEECTIAGIETDNSQVTAFTISATTVKGVTYSALTFQYNGSNNKEYWWGCGYEQPSSNWFEAYAISYSMNLQVGDTVILYRITDYDNNIFSSEIYLDKRNPRMGERVWYYYYIPEQDYWQDIFTPIIYVTKEEDKLENVVDFNRIPNYLTIEMLENGTIEWIHEWVYSSYDESVVPPHRIEYNKNYDEEWTPIVSSSEYDNASSEYDNDIRIGRNRGTAISVNAGDVVMFRGDNLEYFKFVGFDGYDGYFINASKFYVDGRFKLKGNIMSMINSSDFENLTTFTPVESAHTFGNFFNGNTGLTDASELQLPATTLIEYCYNSMFSNCTSLVNPPELPATTLAPYCYYSMFYNCTSLTNLSEYVLPATTLVEGCYKEMFGHCTALYSLPYLLATTLAPYCYYSMFQSCTNLNYVNNNYLPVTTLAEGCYSYMFSNCTSLNTAPTLPATTLVNDCYDSMFLGCTNLRYVYCLATDISASRCTSQWLYNVRSSGYFYKNSNMLSWTRGVSGIPNNWTVEDAYWTVEDA